MLRSVRELPQVTVSPEAFMKLERSLVIILHHELKVILGPHASSENLPVKAVEYRLWLECVNEHELRLSKDLDEAPQIAVQRGWLIRFVLNRY